MESYIAAIIILAIVGLAAFYVYRSKKNGNKCIGCPQSKTCGSCCSCQSKNKDQ